MNQNEYKEHNADDIDEGFEALKEYAKNAILAAWDGCHKIYLAMDEEKAEFFRSNYDNRVEASSGENLYAHVKYWFEHSCGLKFVNAVWHNDVNRNAGYVDVIAQFATSAEERETCGN